MLKLLLTVVEKNRLILWYYHMLDWKNLMISNHGMPHVGWDFDCGGVNWTCNFAKRRSYVKKQGNNTKIWVSIWETEVLGLNNLGSVLIPHNQSRLFVYELIHV